MLKIGELAKQAQIPQDTLRFYEQKGLLVPQHRSESGYRLYDESDVHRLHFILSAKQVGFTLKEIHELLQLEVTKDRQSCQSVKDVVDQKMAEVNLRIREMKRIQRSLSLLSEACCGGDEPATHCTILEALRSQDGQGGTAEIDQLRVSGGNSVTD